MQKGKLFVVSGPSGAGKGTVVSLLQKRKIPFWLSVSATTRSPRPGEKEGREYYFLEPAEFERLIDSHGLLEWARVHENWYGTPRARVEEHLDAGEHVILEIDPQGALQVREQMPEAVLVFIMPPSMEELRRRLEGRHTEDPEEIEARLETGKHEIDLAKCYDYVLLNTDAPVCATELSRIIKTS